MIDFEAETHIRNTKMWISKKQNIISFDKVTLKWSSPSTNYKTNYYTNYKTKSSHDESNHHTKKSKKTCFCPRELKRISH